MAEVNFYLKNPNAKGKTLIYLFFSYDKQRLKYSSGESIRPILWNAKKQRSVGSAAGSMELNGFLDKIGEDTMNIYRQLKTGDEFISLQLLKEKLDERFSVTKKAKLNLFSFIKQFIDSVKTLKQVGTIKAYQTTLNILNDYKDLTKKNLDFNTINLDFYNDFSEYLIKEKKLSTNTIGKHIKILKVFLNEATERGFNTKMDYKSKRFKVVTEDTEAIYLSEQELDLLYNLPLDYSKRLDKARDLFIVGCYTGLRFSDFSQLRPENFNNGVIKIRTQKTDEVVVVPVHQRVSAIMEKYSNELPQAISNQKLNEYLKEIGALAKINDDIQITKNKGGERIKTTFKKFDLISTHTARRSFATNLFLAGFPAISIMRITGHRTEKAFSRYLKISPEQNADLLGKFWNTEMKLQTV
ncbi:MAG: site-specific integrase [Bacteroidota bacterium]